MLAQDYVQKAWDFLEAGERDSAATDHLRASILLWEAAAHALMAAMQERGVAHRHDPP